jgi:hypothetical protein
MYVDGLLLSVAGEFVAVVVVVVIELVAMGLVLVVGPQTRCWR